MSITISLDTRDEEVVHALIVIYFSFLSYTPWGHSNTCIMDSEQISDLKAKMINI